MKILFFFIGCYLAIFQEFTFFFPKKLVTQSIFHSSYSVNNIQAGIYKGIELRILLHILAPSASTEQMNTRRIVLKK